jgi:hypothetical protein
MIRGHDVHTSRRYVTDHKGKRHYHSVEVLTDDQLFTIELAVLRGDAIPTDTVKLLVNEVKSRRWGW